MRFLQNIMVYFETLKVQIKETFNVTFLTYFKLLDCWNREATNYTPLLLKLYKIYQIQFKILVLCQVHTSNTLFYSMFKINLNNYFNFYVCLTTRLSLCLSVPCFLAYVRSEKYAFWVILRPLRYIHVPYNINKAKLGCVSLKLLQCLISALMPFLSSCVCQYT